MPDRESKESIVRVKLGELGFELNRQGFGYIIRDRREGKVLPALQPTHCESLDTIIELFKLEL